jgi:hypothetical protein
MGRVRWRPKTVALALSSLILFFVPAIGVIVFDFTVRDFVPSSKMQAPATMLGLVGAGFSTWAIARATLLQLRSAISAAQLKPAIGHGALILFAPLFGFVLLFVFFAGPVSYLLHLATADANAEEVRHVLYADRLGHARCRNRVILEGHGILWNMQLCSVPDAVVESLARGGSVVTVGSVSHFGQTVRTFRVGALPANLSHDRTAYGVRSALR